MTSFGYQLFYEAVLGTFVHNVSPQLSSVRPIW